MELERLLSEAVQSESGRNRALSLAKDAKDIADAAVFLSMSLHKFANDSTISAASLESDGPDERYIYENMYASWAGLQEARTRLTNLHLAARKERGA